MHNLAACRKNNRHRLGLLVSSSILALAAGVSTLPKIAMAGPDGCVIVAKTASCEGDQSDGVAVGSDFTSPPVDTLVVGNITNVIMPTNGQAGVLFFSNFVPLITVNSDVNAFGIKTTGDHAHGIGAATSDGEVLVMSQGDVASNGLQAHGILGAVGGTGNVTITSSGNIITTGNDSEGIFGLIAGSVGADPDSAVGLGTGNVIITSTGDITTSNISSTAIAGNTGTGDITIKSTGKLSTLGGGVSSAISSFTNEGDIKITSVGNVKTTGVEAAGHVSLVNGDGNIFVDTKGKFETSGAGAEAIGSAVVGTGNTSIKFQGSIVTSGEAAAGILSRINIGNITVDSTGDIQTGGDNAKGIKAKVDADGDVKVTSNGNIDVKGTIDSGGIEGFVGGKGNVTVSSNGNITVSSNFTNALVNGITGEVIGDGDVKITSSGDIKTTGKTSHGIVAAAFGKGDIEVRSTGNITTDGENSHGINTFNPLTGNTKITVVGSVIVNGANSDGIRAGGADGRPVTVIVSGGTIQGGSGNGAGVVFNGFSGQKGAFNLLTIAADATVKALSGLAIFGGSGDVQVSNKGTITGSVGLGKNSDNNDFTNSAGGIFNSGTLVEIGAGRRLLNRGIISPGGDGFVSTTNLTGDLLLGNTSILKFDIASNNSSDLINVAGIAQLGGDLLLNPMGALQAFSTANNYKIIRTSNGITGTFANIIDNLPDLNVIANIVDGGRSLILSLTSLTPAPPTNCVVTGSAVVCSGGFENGITTEGPTPNFTSPPVDTLTVNGVQAAIAPPAGIDGIEFKNRSDLGININSDTGSFGITTTGKNATGIVAIDFIGNEGVVVDSKGNISTSGSSAGGIIAAVIEGGNVTIKSVGDISTNGKAAEGIAALAIGNGNINITSKGNIATGGFQSETIIAQNESGDITINTEGNITTLKGSSSENIEAEIGNDDVAGNGNISIISKGDITAATADNIVAKISGNGDIKIDSKGKLLSSGSFADSIDTMVAGNGNITITSLGDVSDDIKGQVKGDGDVLITSTGKMVNDKSGGILVFGGVSGKGNAKIVHTGNINARTGGIGAGASSGTAEVISAGNITLTRGFGSGVSAGASGIGKGPGNVKVTSKGDITISGEESHGGIAGNIGFGGNGDVEIHSTGNILAKGSGDFAKATGIEGQVIIGARRGVPEGGDGNVSITSVGDINMAGEKGTKGILGSVGGVGDVTVVSTGNITAKGENSFGVVARVSNGSTAVVMLSGGTIHGGSGEGAGVSFKDSAAGSTNKLDIAEDATVSAESGRAIAGSDGNESVAIKGSITGSTNLSKGDDTLVIFPTANIKGAIDLGAGNDTLVFDGAAGTTASVSILAANVPFAVGVERLEKRGEGTWNVGGDPVPASAALAPAFILAGTVAINAKLPGFDITNETNGRLKGAGEARNITNNGAFAPGNSIGTFTVAGNLVLGDTSILEVEIDSANKSDLINVAGQTTIAGALNITAIGALNAFSTANNYTIINSAGGVTGAFSKVADNLPDLNVVAKINANSVTLALVGDVEEPKPKPPAPKPPAPKPPMPKPPAPKPPSPQPSVSDKAIHPNSMQAAGHNGRLFAQTLAARAMGNPAQNIKVAVLGQESETNVALGASELPSLLNEDTSSLTPGAEFSSINTFRTFGTKTSVWVSGLGAFIDVGGSAAATGYSAKTGGIAGGFDWSFDTNSGAARIGFAGGYTSTHISSGLSSSDINAWHIGILGSVENGPFRLSGALGYGFQQLDFTRVIPIIGAAPLIAKGRADGHVLDIALTASYNIAPMLGIGQDTGFRLEPTVRFDHVNVSRRGYTETGAGILNLTIDNDSISQSWISLGVQMSAVVKNESSISIRPELEINWQHLVGDKRAITTSRIASVAGAAFTTPGSLQDTNYVGIGAGLAFDLKENVTASLRYDGLFSQNTRSHRASAEIKFSF